MRAESLNNFWFKMEHTQVVAKTRKVTSGKWQFMTKEEKGVLGIWEYGL